MADKYLHNNAGTLTEREASTVSAGDADAGKIPALDPTGRLDASMLPVGLGADTAQVTASEALAAGDLVNIHSAGGSARARKADASTSGKEAHGFVLAAVDADTTATVYFEGTNTQVTDLTPGRNYLSASAPGAAAATAPSGAGQVVQIVGFATAATALNFNSLTPIVLG
ncbi:Phage protein [Pseudonocardia sp. Ae168_Ps1]|uniref:hypothetical protein n=1 Tax=unclassified Pseudonocardia TaxID=2619320 RepID=UPI00094B6190|nr:MULTISPECIES: hypothetical protein [unclassified Pseudonocardia]OLL69829.1 Phage protein [Pseudonocardia sp. Ae150A_Ps1]OLL69961.1 Phage protein [Pseudonocardia sp. Ae168_Ps1]OLL89122.1 Phage protein [Pseudonocardia sp. Ae356_Ps1]